MPLRYEVTPANETLALVATFWPIESVFPDFVIPVPAVIGAVPENCVKLIASTPIMCDLSSPVPEETTRKPWFTFAAPEPT